MQEATPHPNETRRLSTLLNYEVLDSEDEQAFDELTQLASTICGTSISLISLVDDHRQWFKSKVGLDAAETSKDIAFCTHAILQENIFEITDAQKDERFHDNPLVTGAPDIRFYAGAPLISPNGMPIGTLCVIDQEPKSLDETQRQALRVLAKQVIGQLELRLNQHRLARLNTQREKFFSMVAHDLRSPFNTILSFSRQLSRKAADLNPQHIAKMASDILNASSTTYQLLDELLQWSQTCLGAASGNEQYQKDSISLHSTISEACTLLFETAKAKHITLNIDVATSASAYADETLVKTVVRNLVANAIKYSGTGNTIHIHTQDKKHTVEISVSDQGLGVGKDKIKALFDSPIQSSSGTAGEIGSGLGLHLCKTFVEMQQGEIWYDDHYTQGARFIFSLPLKADT